MTCFLRVSLTTAIVLGAATGMTAKVHAQQFGPPQQSLYAHNPGSAPTYVNYSEYIPSVPATPKSSQPTASKSVTPAKRSTPAHTTTASAAHPVTLRKKTPSSY